ncbi:MAG: heavy metal translocating P-type ATPase [Eubacteriales bacterium]
MKAREFDLNESEKCASQCCSKCCCHGENENEEEEKNIVPRLIIGAVMFISAMIVSHIGAVPGFVTLIISAAAYIVLGYDIVWKAVRNIFRGEVFDECFLMSVSSLGAFALGEYTEAVAVMLLYQIGEWLSDLAVDKSRDSISDLMNIRPDTAHVLRGEEIVPVDPYEVVPGDILVVRAGERIPTDGVVESGESSLDYSSLTGESVPVAVRAGVSVLSGSVNLDGVIHVKASATAENSTAEKIMDLVENASENKSKSESFITKFARRYTPAVVGIAALVAVIPPLFFHGSWGEWLHRALVTLVISCPCALVISVPLTFFGGLGRASRSGILIKGGNYLEALSNVGTAVFDKTGTLTRGKFTLTEISPVGCDEETLLELAAAAESMSNHPIALSVTEAYTAKNRHIDKTLVSDVSEIPGRGIRASYNGKTVCAGNYAMIKEECGDVPESKNGCGTNLYIAVDGKYLGCLSVTDTLKPDSKEGIAALKKRGVERVFMLTGDRREAAERISAELGLDGYTAELLPDGKLEKFDEIKKSSHGATVFVGDGINDSPVLASADIGIAMGGVGSDAAIEASDIVLMTDEVSKLAEGIDIARRTRRIVIENIVFSLVVKAVFMYLGAMGIASMWIAVIGDVGVMMLAVLNSLRIMR